VGKVRLALDSAQLAVSLDRPVGDDSRLTDFVADQQIPTPLAGLTRESLINEVEQTLAMLSERERNILRLRFGIGEVGEHTLGEIGARFGLTRERIRQIENTALGKLRTPLGGQHLEDFTHT
jgi:RNA polymerase primary sigma factor